MGVKGLWKIVNECGMQEDPSGLTLAIDTSIWVHQYKGMSEIDAIYVISKKIIKLLYHNIKPVFIFDGPPNPLKKKVLDERKKEKIDALIKGIVNNANCKKCKVSIRTCVHGGLLKDNFNEGDIEANTEWGDVYDESKIHSTIHDKLLDNKKDCINTHKIDCSLANNALITQISDIKTLIENKSYSNAQKLKTLVKMRERRKNRLEFNDSSLAAFSSSQIKNIKNRNLVSYYIKKLETNQAKRVGSDCKKSFVLHKNYDLTNNLVKENEENSSSELNEFLELENIEKIDSKLNENDTFSINLQNDKMKTDLICSNNFKKNNHNISCDTINNSVIVCKTESEKFHDGFFGQENFDIDTNIEENVIDYNFNVSRPIKINVKQSFNDESLDFLSIQSIIKDILKIFNMPYLDSPSESDAQCASLCKSGVVDGVITEDSDILLHGGVVYKNFFRKNKYITKYDPKKIYEVMGLSLNDLISLGYILGSDYTVGIKGIGIKKAVEYIKSEDFKNLDIKNYYNIYLQCPVREDWIPQFKTIELEKIIRYWSTNGLDKEKIDELKFYLTTKK